MQVNETESKSQKCPINKCFLGRGQSLQQMMLGNWAFVYRRLIQVVGPSAASSQSIHHGEAGLTRRGRIQTQVFTYDIGGIPSSIFTWHTPCPFPPFCFCLQLMMSVSLNVDIHLFFLLEPFPNTLCIGLFWIAPYVC